MTTDRRETIFASHLTPFVPSQKRHGLAREKSIRDLGNIAGHEISRDRTQYQIVSHRGRHDDSRKPKDKLIIQDLHKSVFLEYKLGDTVQVSLRANDHHVVALRTLKTSSVDDETLRNLKKIRNNRHVVGIEAAFFDDGQLTVAREYDFDITLRVMCGVLPTPLTEAEIATLLHHVVEGLSYIHDELAVVHGSLGCGTVLISLFGAIRICMFASFSLIHLTWGGAGNIEDAIIKGLCAKDHQRTDFKALQSMMVELMEPETWCENPASQTLRDPHRWKLQTMDFLKAAQDNTLGELSQVLYTPFSSTVKRLLMLKSMLSFKMWETQPLSNHMFS